METRVLEDSLSMSMVDFFKEHDHIIKLKLARDKTDINTINWYRIEAQNSRHIKPQNGLMFTNARIICDGKIHKLGCNGIVQVTNQFLPSPEGHLLLKLKGVLDITSKCMATCTCGTSFLMYADAPRGECYLTIATTQQKETLIPIRPFFEADRVSVVSFS